MRLECFLRVSREHGRRPFAMLTCCVLGIGAVDAAMTRRKSRETSQRRIEQSDSSSQSAALHVVIRGGELDQALQILFDVGFRGEPDLFPRLVGFPELARVEMLDSAGESGCEIGLHVCTRERGPRSRVNRFRAFRDGARRRSLW